MINRRIFLGSAFATVGRPSFATGLRDPEPAISTDNGVPPAQGYADFAGSWSSDVADSPTFFAVVPDIPSGIVEELSATRFKASDEITEFFFKRVGTTYIKWFNANVAGKDAWTGKKMDVSAEGDFTAFWNGYLAHRTLTAFELIAYMAVFANEAGGALRSKSEGYGAVDHPGIAYLFDTVYRTTADGTRWRKQTYNRSPSNITAATLFNDTKYISAHSDLPFASQLARSTDATWAKDLFPVGHFPHSASPSNFITEADFFKFRGRGLIQTTWRANYLPIVEYIRAYVGSDAVLSHYKQAWLGRGGNEACTISRSADWDAIFESSSREVLSYAVVKHAAESKYLPLAATTAGANRKSDRPGSVACMGRRIGGNELYGATLKKRVRQICITLL